MEFGELISEAIGTLTNNKLRTGLATLGIVIGIGSVIALISLGQGSQAAVQNQIESLGSNLLTISPGSQRSGGFVQGGAGSATTLTYDDALAITSSGQVPDIINVSPEYQSRTQITAGRNNTNTEVIGVTSTYATVHKVSVNSGVFISQVNVNSLENVAVIGPSAAATLFGDGVDPIGKTIRIKGISFRVIGETVSKGGSGFLNQDNIIYVPLSTAQHVLFGSTNLT